MAKKLGFILLLLCIYWRAIRSQEYVEVQTDLGRVKGYREVVQNTPLDVFLGVPFAEPPTGERRFQRPVTKSAWSSAVDATTLPNSCPQAVDTMYGTFEGVNMWNPNTPISEDCLYLNIWTPAPTPNSQRNLTVMVWLYGGSFAGGSSTLSIYDGRILAARGQVVVVSIQFRVGAFGFLYLDRPDAPGNVGLLDQTLAFRWIHDHIHSFGGDKSRVTLFGESSGAASIALHLMSDQSQRYIKNVILQSASSLVPWGVDPPWLAKQRAAELAELVGCPTQDDDRMLSCLRDKPMTELSAQQWNIADRSIITTPFVPTVDGFFLRDVPENLVNTSSKRVNVLLGAMENEGSYFLLYRHANSVTLVNSPFEFDKYLQLTAAIVKDLDEERSSIVRLVAHEYNTPQTPLSTDYLNSLDQMLGDVAFTCPVIQFADVYQLQGNRVYLYRYAHRTSANPWPRWAGAMHGYEIDHVFGAPMNVSNTMYSPEERSFSQEILKYWTNFAKSGNPNRGENDLVDVDLAWPEYGVDKNYLYLDSELIESRQGFKFRQCRFWKDVFPQLARDPTICGVGTCLAAVTTVCLALVSQRLLLAVF